MSDEWHNKCPIKSEFILSHEGFLSALQPLTEKYFENTKFHKKSVEA